MESKLNRVIRSCVELGDRNPIVSIHDQGAGGNANVLKEIVEPAGARIELRKILIADETLSVLEIWGAEYQEADAILMRSEDTELFDAICSREGCPYSIVGKVTGDGKIILHDDKDDTTPVNLDLETVLGKMPQKVFKSQRSTFASIPLTIPSTVTTVAACLDRVLRLLSVGSKRFLVNKVDRSVTGLVAQQPCVGPLQLSVADYAVIAQTHSGVTGAATSVGEQPIKGLLDTKAMARMAVGEALTNMGFVKVTALEHVKCRGNWMWAAKFPGEAAALYDAAKACSDLMIALGIAIDGGKDSLSMAAKVGEEVVKAPGSLVISNYCTVKDITRKVTPEIRFAGQSTLLLIHAGAGDKKHQRLGGSALAHVFEQIGTESPDVNSAPQLKSAFEIVQEFVDSKLISAGHDRSDGGLIVTLLEMAFAGNCGLDIEIVSQKGSSFLENVLAPLFNEELGLVIEVPNQNLKKVLDRLESVGVSFEKLGSTLASHSVSVRINSEIVLVSDSRSLRDVWESTSFELELKQTNAQCVKQEREGLKHRKPPPYHLSFSVPSPITQRIASPPKVAVIREEGSNGDREMSAAFHMAGFEVWDVKMSDLLEDKVSLSEFRGVAFVGGFSYADVMDSAKGWAGVIRFNAKLQRAFDLFYQRSDSFSLGICNGCQLMALLGWVPVKGLSADRQPRFVRNTCGRLESRWATVRIQKSPAIMLHQMENSVLGVWSVHGEGRAHFPDPAVLQQTLRSDCAPIRFVDDDAKPTEVYPCNPSGSVHGIAGLCSPDGRHLAMMPHSERSFLRWQWPYMPQEFESHLSHQHQASPWLKMFQNAFEWCRKHPLEQPTN